MECAATGHARPGWVPLREAQIHGRAARVRTSSDDANAWMRAINERLGFVPVESEVLLQKRRPDPGPGRPA